MQSKFATTGSAAESTLTRLALQTSFPLASPGEISDDSRQTCH